MLSAPGLAAVASERSADAIAESRAGNASTTLLCSIRQGCQQISRLHLLCSQALRTACLRAPMADAAL